MGSSQSDKAASHERIVSIAAARIRQDGIHGINVADIMREAGLTHGGFYRHFGSRDELVTEALALALWEGSVEYRMDPEALGARALPSIIKAYLSRGHRDAPATGCAISALAEDMSRASDANRALYAAQVEKDIELLESLEPISKDPESHLATLTLSALVGALSIARAVGDPALSRRILKETSEALMAAAGI
jgi:TetR/AcrR family transcriptional repressor of nem operon